MAVWLSSITGMIWRVLSIALIGWLTRKGYFERCHIMCRYDSTARAPCTNENWLPYRRSRIQLPGTFSRWEAITTGRSLCQSHSCLNQSPTLLFHHAPSGYERYNWSCHSSGMLAAWCRSVRWAIHSDLLIVFPWNLVVPSMTWCSCWFVHRCRESISTNLLDVVRMVMALRMGLPFWGSTSLPALHISKATLRI